LSLGVDLRAGKKKPGATGVAPDFLRVHAPRPIGGIFLSDDSDRAVNHGMAFALAMPTPAFATAAFTFSTRTFAGFAGQRIDHGFDCGMPLAFSAWALACLACEAGGSSACTDSQNCGGHGKFVEFHHDWISFNK
jgi:hypothetical protein